MADRKKHHWLSRLSFGSVSLALAVLLLLSYLSMVIDPAKAWFFTIFGLLYPLVAPLCFILFIWSLFRRSRMRGVLLVALLPSLFIAGRYYQLRGPEPEAGGDLKVISYNVGLFAHASRDGQDRLALADSVCAYLRKADADIICLQEFYLPLSVPFEDYLHRQFPGYQLEYYVLTGKSGHAGNVTLNRRPVTARGKDVFEKSTNQALWTDIKLDQTTLRVYNCHFESYNISLPALLKGFRDEALMEETGIKMRRSIKERPGQVAEVLREMDSAPVRSVVLGDFNDNPLSYTYFRLIRGRKDSFVRAGKGFGATYRSFWPLLRIDYILYPPDLEAVSHQVPRVRYSDHYPVIATYHESGRNL